MRIVFIVFICAMVSGAADLRLGIIGTDTSHVTAFTKTLNDPTASDHVAGARVVVAYKGGSADIESSRTRVDGYAQELQDKWGVKIVDSIAKICPEVDGILLESVDGRPHLAQMREAVACGKPVFVDKPLASTLDDARAIARVAKDAAFRGSAPRVRASAKCRNCAAAIWKARLRGVRVRSKNITSSICRGTRFIPSRCCTRSWARDVVR